jgi:hypothetical protein
VVLIETHLVSWSLAGRCCRNATHLRRSAPRRLTATALWDHPAVPMPRELLLEIADRVPTAPVAATGLLGGFAVAVASGSRPLGGAVMAVLGIGCIAVWLRRDGRATAVKLTATGLLAFALSHLLGVVIGAWPSVIVVSAVTAALCWRLSDSRRAGVAVGARASAG